MLQDKVWWITGASSGLGAALAQSLAEKGARLVLSGRNTAGLEEVAAACTTETMVLPFEATDFGGLEHVVDRAWTWASARGLGISGLINNAGVSQRSLALETAFDVYRRIIDIDLLAPIALTQALLPRMAAAGDGRIVAISSVAGLFGAPLRSAYSAAKHGLIGYHDSVRAETAHLGIKVLVVAPGSVRTNVSRNALGASGEARGYSDAAIENGMDPREAANRIRDAIEDEVRELVLAEGREAELVRLRRSSPDIHFDMTARAMARGYAAQMDVRRKDSD